MEVTKYLGQDKEARFCQEDGQSGRRSLENQLIYSWKISQSSHLVCISYLRGCSACLYDYFGWWNSWVSYCGYFLLAFTAGVHWYVWVSIKPEVLYQEPDGQLMPDNSHHHLASFLDLDFLASKVYNATALYHCWYRSCLQRQLCFFAILTPACHKNDFRPIWEHPYHMISKHCTC